MDTSQDSRASRLPSTPLSESTDSSWLLAYAVSKFHSQKGRNQVSQTPYSRELSERRSVHKSLARITLLLAVSTIESPRKDL